MESKLTLKSSNINGNPYRINNIEFIEFNFDGSGSALVIEDKRLTYRNKVDVHEILFGGSEIGGVFSPWFQMAQPEMRQSSIH